MSHKKQIDILTCGSAVVDTFANTHDHIVEITEHGTKQTMRAYPVGSKIIIQHLEEQIGGGGTNTAVCISSLGFNTGFIGCLGQDTQAQAVLDCLESYRTTFYGHQSSVQTGKSIVLDSTGTDRTILTYKGANNHFTFSKVKQKLPQAKGLYCSSMVGSSFTSQLQLCKWAKKNNMLVAYNPSSYQVSEGLEKIKPLLKTIDILIFNKEEAAILVGKKRTGRDYLIALHEFVPTVVVTDGSHTTYGTHDNQYYELHPPKSKIVETTGAGDAFASTLFAALTSDISFADGLRLGLVNAQSVISKCGAKEGLQPLDTLQKFIKKPKFHNSVRNYGPLIQS